MTNFCLPKRFTAIFIKALQDGSLNPDTLRNMSSPERRATFKDLFDGDDTLAKETNALFESKLLLKDQQKGILAWAKQVAGLTEEDRKTIADKVGSMENILTPATEQAFLADLANKKLGIDVSAEEANKLFEASQDVAAKKDTMLRDIDNVDNRISYGRALLDFRDMVNSMKPDGRTWTQTALDVASVPKTALTGMFHFSAPFVQGWGMMSTQRAWQAFGQMFKYFASEDHYQNLNAYIISHPDYKLAVDGKLGLTELSDRLTAREEGIQSTLVEKANEYLTEKTGVPNLIRMSSRGFTGYLNYVRFNRFTDLLQAARMSGEDIRVGSNAVKDLARVVNNFTGRGELGVNDSLAGQTSAILNSVFFSPRKMVATFEMFNPTSYVSTFENGSFRAISPTAQKAAIRQLSGSLAATGAILGIATAMGASVNLDPRSQDFLKIAIGGEDNKVYDPQSKTSRTVRMNAEKLDVTGGNSTYLRLLARIYTGQQITSKGKLIEAGQGLHPTTRAGMVSDYVRGKLSPVAALVTDALYGKDPIGRSFDVSQEAKDKLIPISVGAWLNYYYDNPNDSVALIPSLSAMFGVSLESPLAPVPKQGLTTWGEPSVGHEGPSSPVDKAMMSAGINPSFPPQTINGIKLTDDQYKNYIQKSGMMAKMQLDSLVSLPGFEGLPLKTRQKEIRQVINSSRKVAQDEVIISNPDLIQKSMAHKQEIEQQSEEK